MAKKQKRATRGTNRIKAGELSLADAIKLHADAMRELAQALAKQTETRFRTAMEFAQALRRFGIGHSKRGILQAAYAGQYCAAGNTIFMDIALQ